MNVIHDVKNAASIQASLHPQNKTKGFTHGDYPHFDRLRTDVKFHILEFAKE